MKQRLHSLSETDKARLFRELGFVAYARLWRTEERERINADRDAQPGNVAVANAGEASQGGGR